MVSAQGKNLPKIRKRNLELIKEMIYKYRAVSRAEIAETLSLTPPTITTVASKLIRQGIVIERESVEPNNEEKLLGRRRIMLTLNPAAHHYIGVELSPYHTTFCVANLCGEIVHHQSFAPSPANYLDMLSTLAEQVNNVITASGIERGRFHGMVVGLPGFIDRHEGMIRNSIRGDWNQRYFANDLMQHIDIPVRIENNVRVRSIGAEFYREQELRDVETLAYYFISSGIACSMMIKSSVVAGYTAGAGEVGHMVVDINGPVCETCGNRGCLEALASEKAILAACRTMVRSGRHSLLNELCPNVVQLEMKQVMQAYGQGDTVVTDVMESAVNHLGLTLANIINFISPQVVIVDGYIFQNTALCEQLQKVVRKNLFALNASEVNLIFAEFDRFGGAKGAVVMAVREFFIKAEIEEE